MRSISLFVLCGALLWMPGAVLSAPDSQASAEYVAGSVKSIPFETAGILDLTNPSNLEFHYGDSGYSIAYHKIKDFEFVDSHHKSRLLWGKVPVPVLPWMDRTQVLNLSFHDSKDQIAIVSFRLPDKAAGLAEWTLSQRVDTAKKEQMAGGAALPESWWGDRYWKTNRNKPTWPDPALTAAPAGAGGSK